MKKQKLFVQQNEEAAHLILADPNRYGGEGSLPVQCRASWRRREFEGKGQP
jgi:hypothetical protein